MRWLVPAATLAAAGSLVPAAAAVPIAIGPPVTVVAPRAAPALKVAVSSSRRGARPVALQLAFPSPLQCGQVTGTLTVDLPAAVRLPETVKAAAVTLNGRTAGTVTVTGSTLRIAAARPHGMMCMSIVDGTARVLIGRAANLGNPARRGIYTVTVQRRGETLHGRLAID